MRFPDPGILDTEYLKAALNERIAAGNKREAMLIMLQEIRTSERRVSSFIGLSRATMRYPSQSARDV